jgi:hypothetical protein
MLAILAIGPSAWAILMHIVPAMPRVMPPRDFDLGHFQMSSYASLAFLCFGAGHLLVLKAYEASARLRAASRATAIVASPLLAAAFICALFAAAGLVLTGITNAVVGNPS